MSNTWGKKDFYQILGVAPDATPEEIKKQFRALSKKWHPDRNPSNGAKERFQEITAAYAVLSDPSQRQRYNRTRPSPTRTQASQQTNTQTATHSETPTGSTAGNRQHTYQQTYSQTSSGTGSQANQQAYTQTSHGREGPSDPTTGNNQRTSQQKQPGPSSRTSYGTWWKKVRSVMQAFRQEYFSKMPAGATYTIGRPSQQLFARAIDLLVVAAPLLIPYVIWLDTHSVANFFFWLVIATFFYETIMVAALGHTIGMRRAQISVVGMTAYTKPNVGRSILRMLPILPGMLSIVPTAGLASVGGVLVVIAIIGAIISGRQEALQGLALLVGIIGGVLLILSILLSTIFLLSAVVITYGLSPFISSDRRGWHDRLAKTLIVRAEN